MTHVKRPEIVDHVGAFVGAPALLAAGPATGPLAGTDVAVKDLIDVAGSVTGAGNPAFARRGRRAIRHAEAIRRLVDAGASVVGKTVTDELAFSLSGTNVHFGTPVNVAAPGRIPGGSSAGSAAAVAAGLVPLAVGTDTGGSIRIPASYCGIVGWRPSHGAVSTDGVVPLAPSFDTVGLLARDIADVLRAAHVLIDHAATTRLDRCPPSRILVIREMLAEMAGSSAQQLREALEPMDVAIDEVTLGVDLNEMLAVFRTIQGYEAWQVHGQWIESNDVEFGPGIAARFRAASKITPGEAEAARTQRVRIRSRIDDVVADGTVIAAPAAPGAAPMKATDVTHNERHRASALRLSCCAGLAGLPTVALPILSDQGLPLGVTFTASANSDLALLTWLAGGSRCQKTLESNPFHQTPVR